MKTYKEIFEATLEEGRPEMEVTFKTNFKSLDGLRFKLFDDFTKNHPVVNIFTVDASKTKDGIEVVVSGFGSDKNWNTFIDQMKPKGMTKKRAIRTKGY